MKKLGDTKYISTVGCSLSKSNGYYKVRSKKKIKKESFNEGKINEWDIKA